MGEPSIHHAAFERSTLPSAILDSAGRVVDVNAAYLEMSGRIRADIIGESTIDLIHADELPGVISGLDRLMQGERSVRHRRRHLRADGSWIPVEVVTCLMPNDDDPDLRHILVQILDHGDEAITIDQEGELVTRQLYQPVGDAACLHGPDGRIAFVSPTMDQLLVRPKGWIIGRLITDPDLDPIGTDGVAFAEADDPALQALGQDGEISATIGILDGSGKRVWLTLVAGRVDRPALPVRMSLRDISELVEAQQEARRLAAIVEEQLAHRANHDDLTGLTARRIVLGQLDEALDAGRQMSVVFVDLDGFKAINDDLGHLVGDDILIGVADRLREIAGDEVTVGRAGGDEFIGVTASAAGAEDFAAKVAAAAQSPEGLVASSPRRVSASVGVAHSEPADDRSRLLTRADRSMYEAKRSARDADVGSATA